MTLTNEAIGAIASVTAAVLVLINTVISKMTHSNLKQNTSVTTDSARKLDSLLAPSPDAEDTLRDITHEVDTALRNIRDIGSATRKE